MNFKQRDSRSRGNKPVKTEGRGKNPRYKSEDSVLEEKKSRYSAGREEKKSQYSSGRERQKPQFSKDRKSFEGEKKLLECKKTNKIIILSLLRSL